MSVNKYVLPDAEVGVPDYGDTINSVSLHKISTTAQNEAKEVAFATPKAVLGAGNGLIESSNVTNEILQDIISRNQQARAEISNGGTGMNPFARTGIDAGKMGSLNGQKPLKLQENLGAIKKSADQISKSTQEFTDLTSNMTATPERGADTKSPAPSPVLSPGIAAGTHGESSGFLGNGGYSPPVSNPPLNSAPEADSLIDELLKPSQDSKFSKDSNYLDRKPTSLTTNPNKGIPNNLGNPTNGINQNSTKPLLNNDGIINKQLEDQLRKQAEQTGHQLKALQDNFDKKLTNLTDDAKKKVFEKDKSEELKNKLKEEIKELKKEKDNIISDINKKERSERDTKFNNRNKDKINSRFDTAGHKTHRGGLNIQDGAANSSHLDRGQVREHRYDDKHQGMKSAPDITSSHQQKTKHPHVPDKGVRSGNGGLLENLINPANSANEIKDNEMIRNGKTYHFGDANSAKLAEIMTPADGDKSVPNIRDAMKQAGYNPPGVDQPIGHQISPSKAGPGDIIAMGDNKYAIILDKHSASLNGKIVPLADSIKFSNSPNIGIFHPTVPSPTDDTLYQVNHNATPNTASVSEIKSETPHHASHSSSTTHSGRSKIPRLD